MTTRPASQALSRRGFLTTGLRAAALATAPIGGLSARSAAGEPSPLEMTGGDPAQLGAWEPRVPQPHIPIHLGPIPGTDLMHMLFGFGAQATSLSWVYDPGTRQVLNPAPYHPVTNRVPYHSIPLAFNGMCGGAFQDPHGAIRYYGGIGAGAERSVRFRYRPIPTPQDPAWTWGPWLSEKKAAYYPSAFRTGVLPGAPEGLGVIAFGRRSYIDAYDLSRYGDFVIDRMPASANQGSYAGPSQNYPRMFWLSSGVVGLCGTQKELRILDLHTATWQTIGAMRGRRYDGTATVLDSGTDVLLTGGDEAWPKTHQERVDFRTGIIRETAPSPVLRYQPITVILVDGTVLTLGGTGREALAPECYDPVAETCRLLSPTLPGPDQTQRAYHGVAHLCTDGSVLWGGGNPASLCKSVERFLPPYLWTAGGVRAPRPAWTLAAGSEHAYGAPVLFASDAPITRVVLMVPGIASHNYNATQRRVVCAWSRPAPGIIRVTMPTAPECPPGWVMAFALQGRVPSLAQWIRLGA